MSNAALNTQTPQRFSGEWETKRLSEFGNVVTGATPSTKVNAFWNGPYPWITPTDITSERDLTVSERMITQEGLNAIRTLPSNTVLITCIASIGKNAILRTTGSCNQQINAVIPNSAHNTEFLYYLFEHNSDFLLANAGITATNIVSKSTFSNLVFKVPPLPEQHAIAEALSDVDGLLNALEALIAKKQAIKQATMQQLLAAETRLPGFSGAWETKRLGELGTFAKGRGIKRDDVSYEGLPCIRYGELYTRYQDYISKVASRIPPSVAATALPIKTGDLLFAGSGETAEEIGRCAAYVGKEQAYAGGDIIVLTPSGQNSIYLGHLMNHPIVAEQKARLGQGDAVVHISANNLAQVQIKLPPITEQNAIAAVLSDMDAEITALEQRRDKTRAIKHGMMQQLLTGRARLVKKKYTKMPYRKSPYFETPQKYETIWKYMPIDKFMAMLSEGSLYFPNIYLFNDKSEGKLSSESLKEVNKTDLLNAENTPVKQDDGFIRQIRQKDVVEELRESEPHREQEIENILDPPHSFQTLLKDFSNHLMFCNSWFLKGNESHSMWAEYGDKRNPTSVAIQTTVGDLIESFEPTSYQIHIGRIKYKNYNKEHIKGYENFLKKDLKNPNDVLELFYAPILHKRNIYDDEKEVRAIISFESICENYLGRIYTSDIPFYSDRLFKEESRYLRADQTNIMKDIPKGISIKVNLQTLLKAIVISPNANEYFREPFRKLIKNYNIDPAIVRRSVI